MGCFNQYKARGCSYTECKSQHMLHTLALWGLVTNNREGGLQTAGGGGVSEVLPLQKEGGAEFCFSRAEGGGGGSTKSCEVVLTWELEILAIVIRGGGAQKVSTL